VEKAILLGPFRLLAPIAQGGMGEVWRGEHVEERVPVAVKVMTSIASREPRYRAAFAGEVRHMASLDHPAIALVFDHGEIGEAAARASEGRLASGSPYLVMEYASGGTLADANVASWRALKAILTSLLDALAHAHARGVVHRDLKPGNVLVGAATDHRPGLKLTDFGIARALDRPTHTETPVEFAGTLTYMAPEQILGRWRDDGPWTDLYALGGVAWRLATGRAPFHGQQGANLRRAHLLDAPPPFLPRVPVPDGFEAWLRRALEKDLHRRWQRAADAAWALADLPDPDEPSPGGIAPAPQRILVPEPTTLYQDPDLVATELPDLPDEDVQLVATGGAVARPQAPARHDAPPVPPTWRRPPGRPRPPALSDVGLAMWGLRRVPAAGREPERDALWTALRTVHEERRAGLVVVRGPSGVGKHQLLDAVVERAHELGAAHVLHVEHAPDEVPGHALARLGVRELRTAHLWRPEVEERVEAWLDAHGGPDRELSAALTELLCPATARDTAAGARVVRLETAAERHTALRRLVERLAADRAVILRLDEVQYGADALDFVAHLLDAQGLHPSAVLVLLSASDDALPEREWAANRLERLAARPGASIVRLGPLDPQHHAALVRELLPLDPALARVVEERTARTPLLAVQLVGDLVQRRALEPGPKGFRLRSGATVDVPDDLQAAWIGRVARWLDGLGGEATLQLERAAVLGREVDRREWAEVGGRALTDVRRAVLERLLEARAARRTDSGFVFVNDTLREALLRAAREAGRLEAHHEACAELARRLRDDGASGANERLGMHLLGAGRREEAIEPLLRGVSERRRTVGFRGAMALLDVAEQAAASAGIPASDARWGALRADRVRLLRSVGDIGASIALAEQTTADARRHGWRDILPLVATERAYGHLMRYQLDEARRAAEEVLQDPELAADPMARGRTLSVLGGIAVRERAPDRALELLTEALACFRGHDDQAADCRRSMAQAAFERGDLPGARRLLMEALAWYEPAGVRYGIAECHGALGEIARREGDLAGAEDAYRRAVATLDALGSAHAVLPRLNLGITRHLRGDDPGARATLEAGLRSVTEKDRGSLVGTIHALLLPVVAALGDWAAFDAHLADTKRLLGSAPFADPDILAALDEAAGRAQSAGRAEAARECAALGDRQLAALTPS
jgi:tetratricopeptide (TPR) repeat protein